MDPILEMLVILVIFLTGLGFYLEKGYVFLFLGGFASIVLATESFRILSIPAGALTGAALIAGIIAAMGLFLMLWAAGQMIESTRNPIRG